MVRKNLLSLALLLSLFFSQVIFAHGSMEIPLSRIYNCYKEGPENVQSDACKAFVAMSGKQPLYDWDMINQSNANDQHRSIIPDGTLCAGGRDKYKGLDLPRNDWNTTTIAPDSRGRFTFVWRATVPHAIKYFQLYVTKESYDFSQPMKWSDLEDQPFCTITSSPLDNGRYNFDCPMPRTNGKGIIYAIWQRIDSPEAFYSCSDVIFTNGLPTTWQKLDDFIAYNSVSPNTQVVFWLMNDCTAVESFTVTIAPGQNLADQWPFYLATAVNAKSNLVHIGQLDTGTGNVTPVMGANANKVYVKSNNVSHYYFIVDFIRPGAGISHLYSQGRKNCQEKA